MKFEIRKEDFLNLIGSIKETEDKIEKINDVLNDTCMDSSFYPPTNCEAILCFLEKIFNDKNNWIPYYIFELEFGRKWEPGLIKFNNEDIKLATAEDLYNLLCSEYAEN